MKRISDDKTTDENITGSFRFGTGWMEGTISRPGTWNR